MSRVEFNEASVRHSSGTYEKREKPPKHQTNSVRDFRDILLLTYPNWRQRQRLALSLPALR